MTGYLQHFILFIAQVGAWWRHVQTGACIK